MEITELQQQIVDWADTVHPNRLPEEAFEKLLEEIDEWKQRPCDGHEAADVLILILDICHLAGLDPEKIVRWKMRINQQRNWEIQNGILKHTGHS